MSNVTVCARFRPLSSKERREHGDSVCIRSIDSETLAFKDDKEELTFSFDRVFYQDSEQADVYGFLALPIVQDSVNAINGTIITYGQTGAGKTYTMEGPSILECNAQKNGLLTRVVDGLFELIGGSDETTKYRIKLSMVEIYMEKVRDLLDITKDNIQIKESKIRGIVLSGVTEVPVPDPAEALRCLSSGIANRAVGETQMNMASSRSHCVYLFTVQQELTKDERVRTGKLILVDLAGSEKVEKTGAEGRILEEAKTINKSLSALGNVINALTSGVPSKANHIPYRDSKLSRILQDALGGNSRTALLCCCSPSLSNAPESLSTLRFGARAKHIKTTVRANCYEEKPSRKLFSPTKEEHSHTENHSSKKMLAGASSSKDSSLTDDESCKGIAHSTFIDSYPTQHTSRERMLKKLRERLNAEDFHFLEELFEVEGIFSYPDPVQDLESAYKPAGSKKISALQKAVEGLAYTVEKLNRENKVLGAKLAITRVKANVSFSQKMLNFLISLVPSFSRS